MASSSLSLELQPFTVDKGKPRNPFNSCSCIRPGYLTHREGGGGGLLSPFLPLSMVNQTFQHTTPVSVFLSFFLFRIPYLEIRGRNWKWPLGRIKAYSNRPWRQSVWFSWAAFNSEIACMLWFTTHLHTHAHSPYTHAHAVFSPHRIAFRVFK